MARTKRPQRGKRPLPDLTNGRTRFAALRAQAPRFLLGLGTAAILAALGVDWGTQASYTGIEVGEIAKTDIRIPTSIEVVDEALTEEQRQQAMQQTLIVFEHDVLLAREAEARLNQAFSEIRQELRGAEQARVDPAASDPQKGEEAEGGKRPRKPPPDTEAAPVVPLAKHLDAFQATLRVSLRDTDLASLQVEGFTEDLQRDISTLCRTAMQDFVVLSRDDLPPTGPLLVVEREGQRQKEFRVDKLGAIRDLKEARRLIAQVAKEDFGDRPAHIREAMVYLAGELFTPNLRFEASETSVRRQLAASAVQPVIRHYQPGQILLRSGDEVDVWTLEVLEALRAGASAYNPLQHYLALSCLLFFFLVVVERFGVHFISKFGRELPDLFAQASLLILVAAVSALLGVVANGLATAVPSIPPSAYAYAVPVATGGIMVRTLINSETTVLWALIAAPVCAMTLDGGLLLVLFYFVSALSAAGGVGFASERGRLLRAGFVAALVNAAVVIAADLVLATGLPNPNWMGAESVTGSLYHVVFAVLGGLISGVLAVGLVPLFENLGFLTDSRLLELASLNHPVLREMIVKAPGTYHHSMVVGSLAEAAAKAIHANSLLVRVGAYFHDIGKLMKPLYFIENQREGNNPHDRLTPSMSALIIVSHVKEGIELGRQHGLPEPLIDMIPQHHGTSVVAFFHNKAVQQADPEKGEVNEEDYRYPGPKPQTKEAAIMMLADGVEAATRSLTNHSPGAIRARVQKIVNKVVGAGQLEECPLTLKDLHTVSETFVEVLLGIHHHRIEYPAPPVPGEGRSRGVPAGSITLELPDMTPNPDGIHPLTRAEQIGPDATPPPEPASPHVDGSSTPEAPPPKRDVH